ncbi:M23 family metallopeptidase [Corynebacterium pacaense]|uniref:M23 family metallopeptidase n=1 Tax=Corynebacterium pacaense TaxID=1816684 RepID=UPI0009BB8487|nr:M23 family metallopeptidase [Corynebacterium pacaense]
MRTILSALITILLLPIPAADAYVNPATGQTRAGRVLRSFDKPARNWLPGHRGVDLDLQVGRRVLAAGPGTVAFSGDVAGTPTISIDHPDGIRTTYQPVHPLVGTGDRIEEGDVIGVLGHPTTAFPGLQWGARRDGDYINPIGLLPAPTIRLKPLVDA